MNGYVAQIFETTAMVLLGKCGELEATRTINLTESKFDTLSDTRVCRWQIRIVGFYAEPELSRIK